MHACIYRYVIFYIYRSFGVLLWEVVTYGEAPLDKLSTEDIIERAERQSLIHTRLTYITHTHRESQSVGIPARLNDDYPHDTLYI